MNERLQKLLCEAADCEAAFNLATDNRIRATFARLTKQYRRMAEALRADILTYYGGH